MKTTAHYDVIVVGAGIVGAAFAAALGHTALKVAIIEAHPPSAQDDDPRGLALTHASENFLTDLKVWPRIPAAQVCPYYEMHVWDNAGAGQIHFDSAEIGATHLGHIVPSGALQYALWQHLSVYENITVLSPAQPTGIIWHAHGATVSLVDGRACSASLIVGADGSASRVRRWAGMATVGWSYRQHAVVAIVTPQQSHLHTAWQRFLPQGPLAFLPLADGRCSIVWSTTPAHAEELLAMHDDAFCIAVENALEARLGRIVATTPRRAFPLNLQHATHYSAAHVALIGDAAHVAHPLAGQGVNLGLLDSAALAQVLLADHIQGHRVGALATLRRYERWRKGDNIAMLAALDSLKRLFASTQPVVAILRNTGLQLTDRCAPLKRVLIQHALGLSGEVPQRCRYLHA